MPKKKPMKKPKKGGTPKMIQTQNAPGGPYTPGAKRKRNKKK